MQSERNQHSSQLLRTAGFQSLGPRVLAQLDLVFPWVAIRAPGSSALVQRIRSHMAISLVKLLGWLYIMDYPGHLVDAVPFSIWKGERRDAWKAFRCTNFVFLLHLGSSRWECDQPAGTLISHRGGWDISEGIKVDSFQSPNARFGRAPIT